MFRAGFRPTDYAIVYQYRTEFQACPVNVAFMNERQFIRTGADHSASSLLRQDFAVQVIQHFYSQTDPVQARWYNLPEHSYLAYLSGNEFYYDEYSIVLGTDSTHIEVMVRPQRF